MHTHKSVWISTISNTYQCHFPIAFKTKFRIKRERKAWAIMNWSKSNFKKRANKPNGNACVFFHFIPFVLLMCNLPSSNFLLSWKWKKKCFYKVSFFSSSFLWTCRFWHVAANCMLLVLLLPCIYTLNEEKKRERENKHLTLITCYYLLNAFCSIHFWLFLHTAIVQTTWKLATDSSFFKWKIE